MGRRCMPHQFEPVRLTELETNALSLVSSDAYPNPTLEQLSGWSTFGSLIGRPDTKAMKKRKAAGALSRLISKMLVECRVDGQGRERYYLTEFGIFTRDWTFHRPRRCGFREVRPSDLQRYEFVYPPGGWRKSDPIVVYATSVSKALNLAAHEVRLSDDFRGQLLSKLWDLYADTPLTRRQAQEDLRV